jgi:TrmH family RNA methyltransferase
MLSKNKVKHIKSLQNKKFRHEFQQFLVEGAKSVAELLQSDMEIVSLIASKSFLESHPIPKRHKNIELYEAPESLITDLGTLVSNNAALAVVKIPTMLPITPADTSWLIALDDVRDPGNLGTIIRMADWYGISNMVCSNETAELYNPKVISATMGSFLRVRLEYADLSIRLPQLKLPVYAADMKGENVHTLDFPSSGILLLGNEANGINPRLNPFIQNRITIPSKGNAESLNVAIAGAIILDNIARTTGK